MKVRETLYKGIQFRSRLEARWAVFFDALGLKWEYEPEGYRMNDGTCYLPDFYVHDVKGHVGKIPHGDGIYIEVKGNLTEDDKRKIDKFQYPIYMVGNFPKSINPWKDVKSEHERQPRYMFSEYTVDGTEEDLWFAKKGGQVYLLRFSEACKNPGIDLCAKARDTAINKKFEYQNNRTEFGNAEQFGNDRNTSTYGNSFFGGVFGDPFGGAKQSKWGGERINIRVPLTTFKAMFLSMPGIREYRLEERVHFNETEDIPVVSSIDSHYDNDRECFAVQYHHMEEGEDIFHNYFEYREILYVPMSGANQKEKSADLKRVERAIKRAIEWIKKELAHYPTDSTIRKQLDEEEDKAREEIRVELNRERLAKEDEEQFVSANNPNRISDLIAAIHVELDDSNIHFVYPEFLRTFQLAEGISAEDKFGPGEFVIDRKGEILLMQMRRTYSGTTAAGRYFNKFDGRVLLTIDASPVCAEDSYKHGFERDRLKNDFQKLIELVMKKIEVMNL